MVKKQETLSEKRSRASLARKTKTGGRVPGPGRPRSDDRCPCGEMTKRRAADRRHRCLDAAAHAAKEEKAERRISRDEFEKAEEKAKAFDAMAENGWWIDGNLEFEGEYVCLKSPNDIVGRSKTSKLAAVQDAMSKDGGK